MRYRGSRGGVGGGAGGGGAGIAETGTGVGWGPEEKQAKGEQGRVGGREEQGRVGERYGQAASCAIRSYLTA